MIYLLFLIFLVIILNDFKKGIIIYAPFKFIFGYGISSYIGTFSLDTIFTTILFVYWFFYKKKRKSLENFPLKNSAIICIISAFIYSLNPFFSIVTFLDNILPYLYILMFFAVINTTDDIKLFIKVLCIYAIILNLNALCELLGNNIIGNIITSSFRGNTFWANDVVSRGNFIRLHSFIPHSIGYGVVNMLIFAFFGVLYIYKIRYISFRSIVIILVVSFLGIFLSGSRSPLLGGIIILLPVILNKRIINERNIATLTIAVILISAIAGNYFLTMYTSLSDSSGGDTDLGGASSWDMRIRQLEYSVYFWLQKFWFGHGHTFDIFQGGTSYTEILGAESVWFPIMMKKGLVGIISYLYITIDACRNIPKNRYRTICLCLMLGWLVIDSATNLPGLNYLFPLYFYIIYYKFEDITNSK